MATSDNGWPGIPDRADLQVCPIPGTDLSFRLAPGGPDWILTRFAARFHKDVESLSGPQLDDWSYAWRPVRGSTTHLSCHASGTAIDLNALIHLRGKRGTFNAAKLSRLRALLKEFTDPQTGIPVIKWGGDFASPSIVDEMHFQIRGDKAALHRVRATLEDDVSFDDRHTLTDADVAAYGVKGLIAGKSTKAYQEIVRFPPGVERLRHELHEEIDNLSKSIAELRALIENQR